MKMKMKMVAIVLVLTCYGSIVRAGNGTRGEQWEEIHSTDEYRGVVTCYPYHGKNLFKPDDRQLYEIREFYNAVKDADFTKMWIQIIGYADGVAPEGVDFEDIDYDIAKKRAFYVMRELVKLGLHEKDMILKSNHVSVKGCEHRRVDLTLKKYKTLDTYGVDGQKITPEQQDAIAAKAVEKFKEREQERQLSDEEYRKLRSRLMADLKDDQDFKDELMRGLPAPTYKPLRPRDITLGGVYFHDFFSDYNDKGGLFQASLSITLFDWLLLRPYGALGASDLGFTTAAGLRLELLFMIKEQSFRFITGGAYRGFDPSRINGNTDGDQWYVPFGLGWNFHQYGYLNVLSGYGSTARIVDEEGNRRFENEDLTDSFFDFAVELGLCIPLKYWKEE